MKTKLFSALLVAAALTACLSVSAFAGTYYINEGAITVVVDASGKQTVKQGGGEPVPDTEIVIAQRNNASSTSNTITITAAADKTATVTISGVNIVGARGDFSKDTAGAAAVSTNGEGDVTVIISGNNTLESGLKHAGLEKGNAGKLTISGTSITTDSLTATGGGKGAGIGGGMNGDGSNITITGCKVTAVSGWDAAGIGGGERGSGSNITILNANVTATGAAGTGAGIGGGYTAHGTDIRIENSTVTATGGRGAAGIGGGGSSIYSINGGSGSDIQIINSKVVAKGGSWGAGIGGGYNDTGKNITVSGSSQVSVQGGEKSSDNSAGSAIGNGGIHNGSSSPLHTDGEPNTSGLMTNGWIKYYTPDTDEMTADGYADITEGTVPVPEPETESHSSSGTTNYRLLHTYIEGEGTVEPAGTVMVRDGNDKTFTLTPAAGYEVGDVVVNHKSLGAVSEFTLKSIATDTSVEVTFVKSGSAVVGTESVKNPSTGAIL